MCKTSESTEVVKGEGQESDVGGIQRGDDGLVGGSGGVPSYELGPSSCVMCPVCMCADDGYGG